MLWLATANHTLSSDVAFKGQMLISPLVFVVWQVPITGGEGVCKEQPKKSLIHSTAIWALFSCYRKDILPSIPFP